MTIRRWISPVLIAALLGVIAPVNTWAAGADLTKGKDPGTGRFQAAISRAASEASANPSLQLTAQPATHPAMPAQSGARMQSKGGGHTGMIIGLVTTAVGIAATVYAVKAVQKETKTVQQPQ
jgi:hypothetical protein